MDPDKKLQITKETRKIATDALFQTLKKALAKNLISEKQFRDLWFEELRKSPKIFPNGWYIPPPSGLIVLFATSKNPKRVLYPSMRPEETWPKNNIYLDKSDGILAFYASPVDRQSGIIGDTEVMVYLGKNKEVRNTLKSTININKEIFEFVKIGQKFSEIAKFANKLITRKGFTNNILSTNDPQSTNIGHTIPATYEDWTTNEKNIILQGDQEWEKVCYLISNKRVFLNEAQDFKIQAPMAFTIEPRLRLNNRPNLPSAWSHSIVFFDKNGAKELLMGFDKIYKICEAEYLC